jgi:L-ascorbate metabolism protein UlaG (beta-lactamase superfamily)
MDEIQITPISHATMVLQMGGQVIYTDPVDGEDVFTGQPAPTIILVTDIHPDHMNADTLKALSNNDTVIIAPAAVAEQLPPDLLEFVVTLKNGEKTTQKGIEIEAIPMYNVPESPESFHTKGRGNGYVISAGGKRVYISGDTSATPEMKALQSIDIAFMTMNLPYTMDIEEAADAVLSFKPKVVHPYHYRSQNGFSDTHKFKEIVEGKDPTIKVELLDFYPQK